MKFSSVLKYFLLSIVATLSYIYLELPPRIPLSNMNSNSGSNFSQNSNQNSNQNLSSVGALDFAPSQELYWIFIRIVNKRWTIFHACNLAAAFYFLSVVGIEKVVFGEVKEGEMLVSFGL